MMNENEQDLYWESLAIDAAKSGFLGVEESERRLYELAKKSGIKIETEDLEDCKELKNEMETWDKNFDQDGLENV